MFYEGICCDDLKGCSDLSEAATSWSTNMSSSGANSVPFDLEKSGPKSLSVRVSTNSAALLLGRIFERTTRG